MAVYTDVTAEELGEFLAGYAVGEQQETEPVSLLQDVADILQDGEDKLWCQTAVERLATWLARTDDADLD